MEPAAVGVDLRGVRLERLVAHLEEVGARHARGEPRGVLGLVLPVRQPVAERRLDALGEARLVQRDEPRPCGRSGGSRACSAATARPCPGTARGRRPPRTRASRPRACGCGRGAGSRRSRRTSSSRAGGTRGPGARAARSPRRAARSAKQPSGSGGVTPSSSGSGSPESWKPSQACWTPRISRRLGHLGAAHRRDVGQHVRRRGPAPG